MEQRTLAEGEVNVRYSIVQNVADTGMYVVNTIAQYYMDGNEESVVAFSLRSILCVPLTLKGEVTGVIYADNRIRSGLFGPKELTLLYAFANQAAIAIDNARLFERQQASLAEITAIRDLMSNVFASIASGVITTDAEDLVMVLNNAAGKILNVSLDQSQSQNVWTVLPTL